MLKKLLNMLFCKFEIIDKWIKLELCFIILVLLLQKFINKLSLILFFNKVYPNERFPQCTIYYFLISTILNLWGKLRSSFLYFSSTRNIGENSRFSSWHWWQRLILTYVPPQFRDISSVFCVKVSPHGASPKYRHTDERLVGDLRNPFPKTNGANQAKQIKSPIENFIIFHSIIKH